MAGTIKYLVSLPGSLLTGNGRSLVASLIPSWLLLEDILVASLVHRWLVLVDVLVVSLVHC